MGEELTKSLSVQGGKVVNNIAETSLEGPLYYCKCIINNEEIEIAHSEKAAFAET
jgi:hypothetical protein